MAKNRQMAALLVALVGLLASTGCSPEVESEPGLEPSGAGKADGGLCEWMRTKMPSTYASLVDAGVCAETRPALPNAAPPNTTVSNPILPINMIFYGDYNAHNNGTNKRIADAKPKTLICNTPAGAWPNGGCDPGYFQSHGIKVYSYLAGGWEDTAEASNRQVDSSVEFNVGRIRAIAIEGSDGVFLDEVSHHPTSDGWRYLLALSNAAKKEGQARGRSLPIICNVGTMVWEPMLSVVCDEIHASERYGRIYNTDPDDPYTFWDPARATSNLPVMMSTMAVMTADQAVALTTAAWGQNISSHYATGTYTELPWWLEDYVAALRTRLP